MSDPIRFHISLNVTDLDSSVAFFRTLFGKEPAKMRSDYAKFETADPPLVLSLEPARGIAKGGALNHLGFRLPDAKSLVAMQERLERSGLRTHREDGVECCYARQTKFWANDPDGNLWEVYTFDGDIDHRGAGQTEPVVLTVDTRSQTVVWEHRMNEPAPDRIPLSDRSADEVQLRGTLNLPLAPARQRAIIAEALRVLKPGGRLFVHVLTGECSVESPELPGPASAVQFVPQESIPLARLEEAGFVRIRMVKFDSQPCFIRDGVKMRELQLEGFAPAAPQGMLVEVIYKGPFSAVRMDDNQLLERGQRVRVSAATGEWLERPQTAAQFTVFLAQTDHAASACGGKT